MSPRYCAGAVLLVASMAAAADAGVQFPEFEEPHLRSGRAIWLENCMVCHGDGMGDAPRPDRFEEWAQRIQQPREVLYSRSIEGFIGSDYNMMPPRGGNPALSDAQVKQAVDYMLRLVEHFRDSPAQKAW
ncbi:MAG: c-type cytochrome [Thiohalocapsa sp.]